MIECSGIRLIREQQGEGSEMESQTCLASRELARWKLCIGSSNGFGARVVDTHIVGSHVAVY